MTYIGLAITHVIYFIQYHWSSFLFYRLQQSNCLSRWKQQISYNHSHMDRLLLFSFLRSHCRLGWIWTCIFMSLLEPVSCTTTLSSTLPCLTSPFVHSTVFDQTNHPFYLVWPIISYLLPCLTNLNTQSAVLLKSEFLPASQNWWHFWSLDCCFVYRWY